MVNFFQNFVSEVSHPEYNPFKFMKDHEAEFSRETPPDKPIFEYSTPTEKYKRSGFLHNLASNVILPAAWNYQKNAEEIRTDFLKRLQIRNQNMDLVAKRFSIKVNGKLVDVFITGQRSTIKNGRWIFYATPNLASYEEWFTRSNMRARMETLKANCIYFNYPGVAGSEGPPNQPDMVEAYKAILKLLEDPNGIAANEIICWGTSIGGGVEGEALKDCTLNENVQHVFIFDQTFGKLDDKTPSHLVHEQAGVVAKKILGGLADTLGKQSEWNLDTITASKVLDYPEVIIQNSDKQSPETVRDIKSDGIITRRTSHARALLKVKPASQWPKKIFIGVQSKHTMPYNADEEQRIYEAIKKALQMEDDRVTMLMLKQMKPPPWKLSTDDDSNIKVKKIRRRPLTVEIMHEPGTNPTKPHKRKHKSKSIHPSETLKPPSIEKTETGQPQSRVQDNASKFDLPIQKGIDTQA